MRTLAFSSSSRFAAAAVLAVGVAVALPSACVPSYIYDVPGSGASGSSSGGTGNSTMSSTGVGASTTTSVSTGGMMTTTTSTTSTIPACSERDCSNPACQSTFECVPPAPTGWTGYFELYDNTATSPGCGGEWPNSMLLANDGIQASNAMCTCSDCPASGQVCSPGGMADTMTSGTVDEMLVIDSACNGTITCGGPLEVPNNWTGACYGPDGFNGGATHCGPNSNNCTTNGTGPCNVSIQALQLKLTGGTCGAPSAPQKTVPPVTWTNNVEACGGPTPGMGCNSGHSCLAKPQGAYVPGICIMQAGVQPCPAGFLDKHIVYDPTQTVDNRDCGPCTCGALTGGSCSATITVYSAGTVDTCSGLIATLHPTTAQGDCQPLTGNPTVGSREATYGAVTQGTCAAGGGMPTGMATAGGATTFCCTQ